MGIPLHGSINFFEELFKQCAPLVKPPIGLSLGTINEQKILYASSDVGLHNDVNVSKLTISDRKIQGNFLIFSAPYLEQESEVMNKMCTIAAILRLNYGNFIAWPNWYEFIVNLDNKEPSHYFPVKILHQYQPRSDGPFVSNHEVPLEINVHYKKILEMEEKDLEFALSVIEDAAKEYDIKKKFFLYYSAVEIVSDAQDENKIKDKIGKFYSLKEWSDIKEVIGKKCLFNSLVKLRHKIIHRSLMPKNISFLERYLQILCLELFDLRLNNPCRKLLQTFVEVHQLPEWK